MAFLLWHSYFNLTFMFMTEDNMNPSCAIEKHLYPSKDIALLYVINTIAKWKLLHLFQFALCGHRTEGGWVHAWQSTDFAVHKTSTHALPTLYHFHISLAAVFFSPSHSFSYSSIRKGEAWPYLWAAEPRPWLFTLDGLLIVLNKWSHCISLQVVSYKWEFPLRVSLQQV